MTIKEAIRILDPKTSREALWEYETPDARLDACNEACEVACGVMRNIENGCGRCKYFDETGYANNDKDHPELRSGWCENLRKEVQACWYCGDWEFKEE
mgnify:CR=1 FL=1